MSLRWRSVDAGEDDDALDGFFSSRRRESAPSGECGVSVHSQIAEFYLLF
jgi:hypothetical protein